jgi:hypothetical protein
MEAFGLTRPVESRLTISVFINAKERHYSITSSARARRVGGTSREKFAECVAAIG